MTETRSASEGAPSTDWLTQRLRLTAFPSPTADVAPSTWWRDVLADSPEHHQEQPKRGLLMDTGRFQGGLLALQVHPMRIDWQWSPILSDEVMAQGIASLGQFRDCHDSFVDAMRKWIAMSPALNRLAFGAVLFVPAANQQEAQQHLATYVRSVRLDPEAHDFSYRINRRRMSRSGIPGLLINRLSTWSVGATQLSEVEVVASQTAPRVTTAAPITISQLELDISTAPDFKQVLPQEALPHLLDELVQLALEIARDGDNP